MSEPTLQPRATLPEALAGLENAANAATVPVAAARAEGESLAAAVAESAKGAFLDWGSATGHEGSQAFSDAASKGRRWRASPTALLSQLVLERSEHAWPYAQALASVCAAACGLGESNPRVIGNASLAASAQLSAVRPPNGPPDQAMNGQPGAGPGRATNPVLAALELTQQRLADLARQGQWTSLLGQPAARTSGSTLDLPLDAPLLPEAFPDIGGPTQPGSAGGLTDPDATPPRQTGPAPSQAQSVRTDQPVQSAEPEPEAKTLEELLAELDALTGLTAVKAEIHRQVALLRVERLRTKAGLRSPTITRHLVFVGNPGTGKTTVARLVGGIYRALGLLSKGQLIEVDRSELVAGYLGQTAIKTSEVVASAVGGVLFIDEAYSLSGDQYGTEAVDTLVKEMEDHRDDLVLIVAGYPDPMAIFVAQNPGLSSRFRTTIEFADYADEELVDIFVRMAESADYDVTEGCLSRFQTILAVTPRGPTFGNGRFARNHLEAAIGRHAWRLRENENPTIEQLRELIADDLDDDPTGPEPATTSNAVEPDAVEPDQVEPGPAPRDSAGAPLHEEPR
jgi:hypothetical protein